MTEGFKVITSKNLTEQTLTDNDKQVGYVANPVESLHLSFIEPIQNGEKQVLIGYDNTFVLPYQDPLVSFGHFLLAKTLSEQGVLNEEGKSVVDLGCGAGFLGNYVSKNSKPTQVTFTDLSPLGIQAALNAYMINTGLTQEDIEMEQFENGIQFKGLDETLIKGIIGDVTHTMQGRQADLSVAAPVYIPGVCEVFPQVFEVFGRTAKGLGSEFYFVHSSMADNLINQASKNVGGNLEDIALKEMPLRVPENYQHLDYMKNLGLRKSENGYVHDLKVSKMNF